MNTKNIDLEKLEKLQKKSRQTDRILTYIKQGLNPTAVREKARVDYALVYYYFKLVEKK